METQGHWDNIFKVPKEKSCQPRIQKSSKDNFKKLKQSKDIPKISKNKVFVVKLNKTTKQRCMTNTPTIDIYIFLIIQLLHKKVEKRVKGTMYI